MLKKLLILDDDPDMLELLKTILYKHFDVFTYTDPIQFFLHLRNDDADMILMDHMVGNKQSPDIIQTLELLRKKQGRKKIPVILHTGHEQIERLAQLVLADGFIRKPSGIAEIRRYLLHQMAKQDAVKLPEPCAD